MVGVYIHIPYCRTKCIYCDFYSTNHPPDEMFFLQRVKRELSIRKSFLPTNSISTIYFGGGTPSLVSAKAIGGAIHSVQAELDLCPQPEVTLEANPDDLTKEYLLDIFTAGVNRLSIGVQSFSDDDLGYLARRHSSSQARHAIDNAVAVGFTNIGIDLIYGLPSSSVKQWEINLVAAFAMPIQHLSAYHLTIEQGTPLHAMALKGQTEPVSEQRSREEYDILCQTSSRHGFNQYEVSNFAKEGFQSRHNSSYWKQIPYLGLGPSAHSYNGSVRSWNPSSVDAWAEAIDNGCSAAEQEQLSLTDRLNEYIMASLRTVWGIDCAYIVREFGNSAAQSIINRANRYLDQGIMERQGANLRIAQESLFVSDGIIADFFQD